MISCLKYRHKQRELNHTVQGITFYFSHDLSTMIMFPLCKINPTTKNKFCFNEFSYTFLFRYLCNDSFDENKQT